MMRAINLKTNHLTAPVGIDAGPLFLSWQCADGVRQAAYGRSVCGMKMMSPARGVRHALRPALHSATG